jgi:ribosomal protein S12 methylthiotransferase accessory factor
MIAGSRDDLFRREYEHQRHADTLASHRALMMRSLHEPMRRFQDAPSREHDTFDEDIAWELRCLRAVGIERVVAVDLTKSAFGLPVARIVIPGLEGPTEHLTNYVDGARGRARMEQL